MNKKFLGSRRYIAQLAKAPKLGEVKTRMNPFLSESSACTLHKLMVEQQIKNLHNLIHTRDVEYTLFVTETHSFFYQLIETYQILCAKQHGLDLGKRLVNITSEHLDNKDVGKLILLGSDCPFIDESVVSAIFGSLEAYDLCFVPATDGGFVALGIKRFQPSIFENIVWGSQKVLAQCQGAASSAGLSVDTLSPLSDIDRPEDLPLLDSFNWRFH